MSDAAEANDLISSKDVLDRLNNEIRNREYARQQIALKLAQMDAELIGLRVARDHVDGASKH